LTLSTKLILTFFQRRCKQLKTSRKLIPTTKKQEESKENEEEYENYKEEFKKNEEDEKRKKIGNNVDITLESPKGDEAEKLQENLKREYKAKYGDKIIPPKIVGGKLTQEIEEFIKNNNNIFMKTLIQKITSITKILEKNIFDITNSNDIHHSKLNDIISNIKNNPDSPEYPMEKIYNILVDDINKDVNPEKKEFLKMIHSIILLSSQKMEKITKIKSLISNIELNQLGLKNNEDKKTDDNTDEKIDEKTVEKQVIFREYLFIEDQAINLMKENIKAI
jgi:hypothetical protein